MKLISLFFLICMSSFIQADIGSVDCGTFDDSLDVVTNAYLETNMPNVDYRWTDVYVSVVGVYEELPLARILLTDARGDVESDPFSSVYIPLELTEIDGGDYFIWFSYQRGKSGEELDTLSIEYQEGECVRVVQYRIPDLVERFASKTQ